MGWENDKYYYTVGNLRYIARHYTSLYSSLLMDGWEIAETKADFDMALNSLSRNLRQAVIADIQKIEDRKLYALGLYHIPKLKRIAYYKMQVFLNGDEDATNT